LRLIGDLFSIFLSGYNCIYYRHKINLYTNFSLMKIIITPLDLIVMILNLKGFVVIFYDV